jgi:nucleoporin POM152
MNGTPRLRSAYPTTPPTKNKRSPRQQDVDVKPNVSKLGSSLPDISPSATSPDGLGPVIPFEVIDGPTQRLYIAGFYVALIAWRLYDFYLLESDEAQSLWLFMKWVAIDGVFLFGLPGLRIPWLEWSSTTMTVLFILHALLDGVLMFRINVRTRVLQSCAPVFADHGQIPLSSGLVALSKLLYDRELTISERKVKPADVIHNSSVILGKQVVHVLPEGYYTFYLPFTTVTINADYR